MLNSFFSFIIIGKQMAKSTFTLVFLIIFSLQCNGQTNCDIINHYGDFIVIEKSSYEGEEFIITSIVETKKKSCFSEFVNNNIKIIDYLLTSFSSNTNYENLLSINDSLTLSKTYISDLKNDSLFNTVMTDIVSKTIDKQIPKDTISFDQLLNVAVKFFAIIKINEQGDYVGKVCVGLNDIKKTEEDRKPMIEAFCFSSIFKHYYSEEFSMINEFVNAIKELYKVNLGIDRDERLLRAQGAMYFIMRNNEKLGEMLKSEYNTKKEHLSFILSDI